MVRIASDPGTEAGHRFAGVRLVDHGCGAQIRAIDDISIANPAATARASIRLLRRCSRVRVRVISMRDRSEAAVGT